MFWARTNSYSELKISWLVGDEEQRRTANNNNGELPIKGSFVTYHHSSTRCIEYFSAI